MILDRCIYWYKGIANIFLIPRNSYEEGRPRAAKVLSWGKT